MKNLMLTIFAIAFFSFTSGQTNTINNLKAKTTKWFKDYYVKLNFKDPYSYKLMDCIVSPITLKDAYDDSKRDLMYLLLELDTTKRFGTFKELKDKLDFEKRNYERAVRENSTRLENYKKFYEYRQAEIEKHRSKYEKALQLDREIDSILNSASEKELSIVKEYRVYIDAYGKNSLGNSVLGKYYYTIDKQGNTISEVKTLD